MINSQPEQISQAREFILNTNFMAELTNEACDLSNQQCVPCSGSLPPATAEEIQVMKVQVPLWDLVTEYPELRLQRVYRFSNFQQALDFTNRVGAIAEAEGHHPALTTEWGKVTVTWWTHAIAGLHENDFIMAAKTDQSFESMT